MIDMKNSGIDLIGETPAHWDIKRLKDVTILNPNYNGGDLEGKVSFVPMESLRCGQIDLQEIEFSEAKGKYTYFADDDLLIAKVTPCFENGNIALAKGLKQGIGYGSSEIFVLRCNGIINKYLFYYSLSNEFQGRACSTMCGVGGLKRISPLFMKTHQLAIPPLAEQQTIADYLDKKTSEIDNQISLLDDKLQAYIKLKKSLISEIITHGLNPHIELKGSGIDWIGKIPAHWELKRMKDISELYTGKSLNDSQKELYGNFSSNDDLPYIGSKDIDPNTGSVNYESGYAIPTTHNGFPIAPKGSSLLCIEGGSAGKKIGQLIQDVYFVNKLCCINSHINQKYVYFFLNSTLFSNQFNENLQGMIGGVSVALIKTFFIICPPLEEQKEMADYLELKTGEIDGQISLIDKKIKSYKSLKQSLIDEVVTGKRKIN